ncbi:hypothetical protein Tco_0411843 [Tanacetum coccineum]
MDHECFDIRDNEFEEKLKAQRIKNQEFLDTFKEFCDNVLKKQREERERIAKEKEAEELEAERKKKECLKIENSLPKASTRSRRSRIDPSLKGFKVFYSRESSVKYPIPTPRELDVIPDDYYDEDYQKRFDELVKDFLSPTSIYDNISIGYLGTIGIKEIDTPITPDIPLREETPRYFYDGSMDNGEDIIPLMRISKETGLPEKIIDKSLNLQNELNNEKNSNSETIADVPIKDSLLMSNDATEVRFLYKEIQVESKYKSFENAFEQNEEYLKRTSSFEEPLDDGLFPLPEVDILPIKVEPVEVMINDSHTYGENISQVEREILSMVDELFNLSNDDETFDPGGGENDVLLNKGENNDLNVFTIRTFLPFVTYPEVLPVSYSTGSEDKVFNPGIFDNDAFKDKSSKELAPSKALLTLDVFDPLHPPLMNFNVFRILEASWFNIVEGQSNSHNFHRWSPIFSS